MRSFAVVLCFAALAGCGGCAELLVTKRAPAEGATGVPLDTTVSVSFDGVLDVRTVTDQTFTLSSDGTFVAASREVDSDTATLTPSAPLKPGTTYTATVTTSVSDRRDVRLGSSLAWSFTTTTDAGFTFGADGGSDGGAACRTYATAYTLVSTFGPGSTTQHTTAFDVNTRKWTDTANGSTSVRTYASVAEFVDEGLLLEAGNGPVDDIVTNPGGSNTVTYTYDAQRRRTGLTWSVVSAVTYIAREEQYTAWDSRGRPTSGRANMYSHSAGEGCTGKTFTATYDDVGRVAVRTYQGGVNLSGMNINWCTGTNEARTSTYDARFIPTQVIQQTTSTSTDTYTVTATAQVCK
ncbi:MAG: Ig-like domain-containing protein [Myxococcaceae bacterium]|nr:Ig-like domain-containing protein [Myxococcaceae bacterium]